MIRIDKQTEALNDWLGLDEFDKTALIQNTIGQEWVDSKDIKYRIKVNKLRDKLAAKRAKKCSKLVMEAIFYGSANKEPKKFRGLGMRFTS